MKVINRTNGLVLASEAETADTLFRRMKGLLGKRSLEAGGGLVIKPCISIHTFGMRFPIDAVFFDKSNRAVAVLPGLMPNRASRIYASACGVLELPAGVLADAPVSPGDELEFIP